MMDSETRIIKAYLELFDQFLYDKEFAQSSHKMADLAFAGHDVISALNILRKDLYDAGKQALALVNKTMLHSDEMNRRADLQIKLTEIAAALDHKIENFEEHQRNGAKKSEGSRVKAIKFIRESLQETPLISINKLAKIVEDTSIKDRSKFGVVIRFNTARDYIRIVKNESGRTSD
jgi:hypothetical protein